MPPSTPTEPQQPQYSPEQPPYPQPVSAPPVADDPGKTMGIIGFVLSFFVAPVGLVLSIIGYKKSKQAGHNNGLALAGIILSAIGTVSILLLIALVASSYSGIQGRTGTINAQSAAMSVMSDAENYAASNNGSYPETFSDMNLLGDVDATQATTKLSTAPKDSATVEFYSCEDGNKVGYWDYSKNKVIYEYVGRADESSNCTFTTS